MVTNKTHSDYINIPNQHVFHLIPMDHPEGKKQFIKAIYPSLEDAALTPETMADCVLLTCLNSKVDQLNSLATSVRKLGLSFCVCRVR